MGYVIFTLILLLVILCAVAFTQNKESFSTKTKLTFAFSTFMIIALISIYNILQSKQSEEVSRLRNAYLQGKPLECHFESKTHIVTNTTFNFSNGTMSFLGKPNTPFNHLIIPLEHCLIPAGTSLETESKD